MSPCRKSGRQLRICLFQKSGAHGGLGSVCGSPRDPGPWLGWRGLSGCPQSNAALAAKTEIAWAGAHIPKTAPTGLPGCSTYTAPLHSGGLSWTGRSVPSQLRAQETARPTGRTAGSPGRVAQGTVPTRLWALWAFTELTPLCHLFVNWGHTFACSPSSRGRGVRAHVHVSV